MWHAKYSTRYGTRHFEETFETIEELLNSPILASVWDDGVTIRFIDERGRM